MLPRDHEDHVMEYLSLQSHKDIQEDKKRQKAYLCSFVFCMYAAITNLIVWDWLL